MQHLALVQITAWHLPGDKPLSEPMTYENRMNDKWNAYVYGQRVRYTVNRGLL